MEIKKAATSEIRKINRNSVYQVLKENPVLSRQEIVQKTGLCLPTVTQNLDSLIAQGLVEVSGLASSTGGRKAKAYRIVGNAKTAVGLDITRNHITAVLVDITGAVVHKIRIRQAFSAEDSYYRILGDMVTRVIEESGNITDSVLGVCIGVPALLSDDHQVMTNGEKLGCTGLTCAELSQYIPFSSNFFNDSDSACFAEGWGRSDLGDAFYLMLSNSVGGAYMFADPSGSLRVTLRHSEIGHSTIIPGGELCYCGKHGCANAYCMASVLSQTTGNNLERFFELLQSGDAQASSLWQTYLEHLSYVVSNIRVTMQCKVIIGGYVGAYIDEYIDDLRALTIQRNFFDSNGDYIIPCHFKNESIAAGAALPYIDRFLKEI